jgi:uncharacterized coiled-coil protein SlyX
MGRSEISSDFRQRLDDLEKRLAEKGAAIARSGHIAPEHRREISEIYAKARALREKLVQPSESTWDAAKDEIEADWEILSHSFERWVGHVDAEYQRRKP